MRANHYTQASVPDDLSQRRRIFRAAFGLFCVGLFGTLGIAYIEGWELWRGLFFTLISITTVGYGDEGISDAGRKFTMLLLISGIGIASYTLSLLVQSAVAAQLAWRKRMWKQIKKLEKHVVVAGFGRMGRTICEELAQANTPFVVVEQQEASFRAAHDLGYLALEGCAAEDEMLHAAGIASASHLVSAVDSEVENIVITLTARELNPDLIILSRAEHDDQVRKLRRAGANRVVAPFRSGGLEIAEAILGQPRLAVRPLAVSGCELAMTEVLIEEGSALDGSTLGDYEREARARLASVALLRPGETVRVSPDKAEPLRAKDVVVAIGASDELAQLQSRATAGD